MRLPPYQLIPTILILSLFPCSVDKATAQDEGKLPKAYSYIPDDASMIISMDVASTWNGKNKDLLRKLSKIHPIVLTYQTMQMQKNVGIAFEDLDRFVVTYGNQNSPSGLVILTTNKDYDKTAVMKAFGEKNLKKKTMNGKTFFTHISGSFACFFAGKRTLVLGNRLDLEKTLKAKKQPVKNQAAVLVAKKQQKAFFLIYVAPRTFIKSLDTNLPNPPRQILMDLHKADRWWISLSANKGLQLRVRAEFPSQATSKDGEDAFQQGLKQVDAFFAFASEGLAKFAKRVKEQYPELPFLMKHWQADLKAGRKALKSAKVDWTGNNVETVLNIETENPPATAALLLSLSPRQAKSTKKP